MNLKQSQQETTDSHPMQPCPCCGYPISPIAGTKEAICPRCGFKDPCCE